MSAKKKKKTELEKRLEAAARESCEDGDGAPEEEPGAAEAATGEAASVDVEALLAERDELNDRVLRTLAEFENYRKRVAREAARQRQTAAQELMGDLLSVVDNLERALEHAADDAAGAVDGFVEGVRMVLKQMCDVLSRHGLEPIAALGEPFDPNVHEAVAVMPTDADPPDHVVNEFQRGYRLGEFVLRPAKVGVSAAREDGEPASMAVTDEEEAAEEAAAEE